MTRHSIKEYALAIHSRYHKGSRKFKQRILDGAQTPYARLLKIGVFTEDRKRELADIYNALNPVVLRTQIAQSQRLLAKLSERTGTLHPKIDQSSVTVFLKQLT
jgi:hypothetical protein